MIAHRLQQLYPHPLQVIDVGSLNFGDVALFFRKESVEVGNFRQPLLPVGNQRIDRMKGGMLLLRRNQGAEVWQTANSSVFIGGFVSVLGRKRREEHHADYCKH